MKPLPLPVRVAAGLAALAVDHARRLPETVATLPVAVTGHAMRLSMRVQQQVTDLAVRGDDVLSLLRPVEDKPDWATFDEDTADDRPDPWDTAGAEDTGATAGPNPPAGLPDYPGLSLAQVRARLRRLSVQDLRDLLGYEQATTRRPEFERMLSNRIKTVTGD